MSKCCVYFQLVKRYLNTRRLYCNALLYGTILASSAVLADVPPDASVLDIQQAPALQAVISPNGKAILPEIEILEAEGVYHIQFTTTINASARHVRQVLTDFIHIYRLNPSIIESDVLKRHDDESVSVRTRVIGCAAYFCEEMDRVERVRVLPSGELFAEIIPELSQFKSGHTMWRITPSSDERCEVSYSAIMEPDIYIPPIVGELMIKKSIREEMLISFANLEKIAIVVAEKEWKENYQPEHAEFTTTEFAAYDPCVNYIGNSMAEAY